MENRTHIEVCRWSRVSVFSQVCIMTLFVNIPLKGNELLWECDHKIESYEDWPSSISLLLTKVRFQVFNLSNNPLDS